MKSKEERWALWEEKMRKQSTFTFWMMKFIQWGLIFTSLFLLFSYFFMVEKITVKMVFYYFIFFSILGPSFEYFLWKRRFKKNV